MIMLPRVLSSIPTIGWLATICNLSDALLWCVWRQPQCTHIYTINKSIFEWGEEHEHTGLGKKASRVMQICYWTLYELGYPMKNSRSKGELCAQIPLSDPTALCFVPSPSLTALC